MKLVVSWWVLQCGAHRRRRPRTSLRVAMKGACCGRENRIRNKDTGQKNPEINPCISSQFIFHKGAENTQREKDGTLGKQSWICRASTHTGWTWTFVWQRAWIWESSCHTKQKSCMNACGISQTQEERVRKRLFLGGGKWEMGRC